MAAGSQAIVPTPSQIDAAIPGTLDEILTADPVDLALHMEQVWDLANVWAPSTRPVGKGRRALIELGAFNDLAPSTHPAWHHLGYSFCIENTRATQIVKRVVHAFRSGEGLGHPSVATQRWLDATEALLFGAVTLLGTSMSTSAVRPDPEAVRRNAYWRMFGMQLAFGGDDGKPAAGTTVWTIADAGSDLFAPSTAPFMVNYRVADVHGLVRELRAEGCNVLEKVEDTEYGKFAWVIDPDGNKVELWEPPAGQ